MADNIPTQLDAANERYRKNPLRSASEVAAESTNPVVRTPEEFRAKMAATPMSPEAVRAVELAKYNQANPVLARAQQEYLLNPSARQAAALGVDVAKDQVAKLSGGLVAPTAAPDAVTQGSNAMVDYAAGVKRPDETAAEAKARVKAQRAGGHVLVGEEAQAAQKAAEARAAAAGAGEAASVAPATEAAAKEALAAGKGGLMAGIKGMGRKAIPLVGDAILGYESYKESGDPLRGIVTGAGSFGGRALAGLAGVESGPADILLQAGGALGGAKGAEWLYDKATGRQPKVKAEAPAPAAPQQVQQAAPVAPEAPAAPVDNRTSKEKFDDAIWNIERERWLERERQFKEASSPEHAARFFEGVKAKRAMETAEGLGVSADPVRNANAADALASAAERRARVEGGNPESFLPEADPRFPNPIHQLARQILRDHSSGRDMTPADRAAYAMSSTPIQYGNPNQAEAVARGLKVVTPQLEAQKAAQANAIAQSKQTLDYAQLEQADKHFYDELARKTEVAGTNNINAIQSTKYRLAGQMNSLYRQLLNPNVMVNKQAGDAIQARISAMNKSIGAMNDRLRNLGVEVPEEEDVDPMTAASQTSGTQPSPAQRPDPSTLKPGQVIDTPRGKMKWTGTGLVPA